MIYRLLVIGVLLWASAVSSPAALQKVEFHPMMESFVPEPDPDIVRFPHEISCRHFYHKLSEEDITIRKCPDDELFDYLKHRCVEKDSARCWNRLIMDINHEPLHIHYEKNLDKFQCPHPYGHFPDVTNCTRFYQCLSGKSKSKKCAPFEYFDKIKRKCMAEIKAVCADHTDVIEPDYKCPRSWGSFSFSKDCSKYYECVEKRPDLRTCKNHMLFDEKKRKCMPQKTTKCGSRHNPYDHHTTELTTTTKTIYETEAQKSTWEKQTQTDSSIVTTNDDKTRNDLLPKFDSSENDVSSEPMGNSIEDRSSKESSEESSENVILEKKEKTSGPVVTEEFITSERVTPEKVYSETTEETKEILTESIPTTEENKECHSGDRSCILDKDGAVIRCPSPNGLFSYPSDHHKFLHCANNIIHVKKCPVRLVFIESKQACSWEMSEFRKY